MPREIVKSATGPYHVKVGWNHECEVQVGVECDEGRSMLWILYQDKTAAKRNADYEGLGQALLNLLDVTSGYGDRGYQGVWADLGRRDCNILIRLLRRARDSAYGRDE